MSKITRDELESFVSEVISDPEDLVVLLEITVEDLISKFPDKIMENKDKFGLPSSVDGLLVEAEDDLQEEE